MGQPNGYISEDTPTSWCARHRLRRQRRSFYNLPRTDAIFEQFNGLAGAAYFIAGFGMTALTSADENLVVVPIRSGVGLRLGYNVG
jgi:hypothetical protein